MQINDNNKQLLKNFLSLYPSRFIADRYNKSQDENLTPSAIRSRIKRLLSKFNSKNQLKEFLIDLDIVDFDSVWEIIQSRRKNHENKN
jgi:hypothetical protein